MRVMIMCTYPVECSLTGSWPEEGSGSSPSPPWSLLPVPPGPAVKLGPFPLCPIPDHRQWWEFYTEDKASHPLQRAVAPHSIKLAGGITSEIEAHVHLQIPRCKQDTSLKRLQAPPDF